MPDKESPSPTAGGASPILSGERIALGLAILREASLLAQEAHSDPWQFAVEIAELRALGSQNMDLRWLVSEGYAEHAEERTKPRDRQRVFLKVANLAFGPNTCFVLRDRGAQLARLFAIEAGSSVLSGKNPGGGFGVGGVRPRWDVDRRELTWNERLIKKFRLPAENQERILAAFEEDGWPVRIDDPLSRTQEIDPKTRLHESIKALNRNQNLPLLRFSGDGTGQGVVWGVCSPRAHPDHHQTDRSNRGGQTAG